MSNFELRIFQWFSWVGWVFFFSIIVWVVLPQWTNMPMWIQIVLNPLTAILSWLLGYKLLVGPLFCGFATRIETNQIGE